LPFLFCLQQKEQQRIVDLFQNNSLMYTTSAKETRIKPAYYWRVQAMKTTYQIIYWRDIPAQVKVKGEKGYSRPLPERFERAIDRAAMHAGAINTDDYLAEWRKSDWQERDGEPAAVVEALLTEIETAYPEERLQVMARNGGHEVQA
jgi:hypothetical protein